MLEVQNSLRLPSPPRLTQYFQLPTSNFQLLFPSLSHFPLDLQPALCHTLLAPALRRHSRKTPPGPKGSNGIRTVFVGGAGVFLLFGGAGMKKPAQPKLRRRENAGGCGAYQMAGPSSPYCTDSSLGARMMLITSSPGSLASGRGMRGLVSNTLKSASSLMSPPVAREK